MYNLARRSQRFVLASSPFFFCAIVAYHLIVANLVAQEHALEALKNMKFSYSEDNWELYRKRISLIKS